MYSILIAENNKWKYLTNPDASVYVAETLESVQLKVKEILRTIPLESIKVVKNCSITENVVVKELTASEAGE